MTTNTSQVPVLRFDNGDVLALTGRWRKRGGRSVHAAAVSSLDKVHPQRPDNVGKFVVLACETEYVTWTAEEEIKRLGLLKPEHTEVTCSSCLRVLRGLGVAK